MDRERADLEDRTAKRRRFDASTDDGITFRSLLAKAAEGASDAKGFEEKARQLSLGLEVYKAFKEHIAGNHRPLQYNTDPADAIAKFIKDSVTASSKGAAKDLRSYFNAISCSANVMIFLTCHLLSAVKAMVLKQALDLVVARSNKLCSLQCPW